MTRCTRSSSSSSTKKFDVFEFHSDDEDTENGTWGRICSKFANPSNPHSSAISKYDFLQAFACGAEPEPVSKHGADDPIDLDSEQEEEAERIPEESERIPEEPERTLEEPERTLEEPLEVVDDDAGVGDDTATGIGDNQGNYANACIIDTPLQQFADDPVDLDSEQEEAERIPEEPERGREPERTLEELERTPQELLEVVDDDAGVDDGVRDDTATGIGDNQGNYANACTIDTPLQQFADKQNPGYLGLAESDFDFKNQLLDALFNDDDSGQTSSSSTSTSNLSEAEANIEDQQIGDVPVAFKINRIKKAVDVSPDFIQYEDLYSTRSRLIFSCSSLKLEGSKVNGSGETFKIEWEIEDILIIKSYWRAEIETALINLFLKSKDFRESEISNQNPGSKMLKFAVYDSYWSKAEEAIKLLDVRYSDIWSTVFDIDTDNKGSIAALGKDSFFSHRPYFPIFDEAFDEVIYPKGESDAVSISKRDVELLQPETFINDTIIDFYIKYLKNKLPTDEQEKFHFFNSFFFRKLADLDKNPSSACGGREAFQRVRKWTRKVNLFEKDYILIPINYSLHWSLVVICHPGEVAHFGGEEIKESSKVPCILHMDSLKGSHNGLKDIFQSYLREEWKERHANVEDDLSSKFSHLRFISLELPQQGNLYDCGLFLLHYVECFLKEAPINFNPFKITKFSNFLKRDWFPPAEASLKRALLQNLIYDLSGNKFLQAPPADYHEKGLSCEVSDVVKHNVEVDFPGVCSNPAMWHGNPSNSTLDIHLLTASPMRFASNANDLPAAAVTMHSDCLQIPSCFQTSFMSPIEETDEFSEETAISLERGNSQVGMLAADYPSTSCISKDHRASETAQQGFSLNFVDAFNGHSYSRTSTATVSLSTLDTFTQEDQPLKSTEEFNTPDKTSLEYLSTYGEELADSIVQDSQEANDEHDVDVSVKSHSLFRENVNSVTHQFVDLTHLGLEEDDEPLPSESNERDAKRRKLLNASGGPSQRRPLTRSMLKQAYV